MSKFKVGDRVRVKDLNNAPSWVGSIHGTITEDQGVEEGHPGHGRFIVEFCDKDLVRWYCFDSAHLEPVTDDSLEELVRKANKGFRALDALVKLAPDNIEFTKNDKPSWDLVYRWPNSGTGLEYRIKPKPAFAPFETSNGWKVRLEGERLHIGCQEFETDKLKRALVALCSGDNGIHPVGKLDLRGNRNGIWTTEGTLPWADADRILSELEKAGVKSCWNWIGSKSPQGYGQITATLNGVRRPWKAHRVVFGLLGIEIPKGMMVDHICRNRACVNPGHLRFVTPRQNTLENSNSMSAKHAAMTHCKYGHEFTDGNTIKKMMPNGTVRRRCMICTRAYRRRQYLKTGQ